MLKAKTWGFLGVGGLLAAVGFVVGMLLAAGVSGQTAGQTLVGDTIAPAGSTYPVVRAGDVWLSPTFRGRTVSGLAGNVHLDGAISAIDTYLGTVPTTTAAISFLDLADTPDSYAGSRLYGVFVDATGSGITFRAVPAPITSALGLHDMPHAWGSVPGQPLVLNGTLNGFAWGSTTSTNAAAPTRFIALMDTPTSYDSGKWLRSAAGSLVWTDGPLTDAQIEKLGAIGLWARADNRELIPIWKLPANEFDTAVFDQDVTFTRDNAGDVDAGGNRNTRRDAFSVGGQAFEIRRYFYDDDDDDFIVDLANFDDAKLAFLRWASLAVEGDLYHFADARSDDEYDPDDVTRELIWSRVGPQPAATGPQRVRIYAPRIATAQQPGLMSPQQVAMLASAGIPVLRLLPDPAGFTASDDGTFPTWNSTSTIWDSATITATSTLFTRYSVSDAEWQLGILPGGIRPDQLPDYLGRTRTQDFLDDLTGDGYVLAPGATARTNWQARPSLTQAAAASYDDTAHEGPRFVSYWYAFRLPAARRAEFGAGAIGGAVTRLPASQATYLGDIGGFSYWAIEIPDKPVGYPVAYYTYDVVTIPRGKVLVDYGDLANVVVTPTQLGLDAAQVGGQVVRVNTAGTGFSSSPLLGQREVFAGSATGLFVGAANTASQIQRTTLQDPVNVNDEGHGLIGGSFTLGITSASANTIGWGSGGGVTINRTDFLSLETLAASPDYLASSSQFGVTLLSADVYDGATPLGVVVVRLAHDSSGVVALNAQYLPEGGVTSTRNWNVTITGNLILIATGAPRGESGTGGPIFEFLDTLPAASSEFPDGSLAVVYSGADIGGYRKGSTHHPPPGRYRAGRPGCNPHRRRGELAPGHGRPLRPPVRRQDRLCQPRRGNAGGRIGAVDGYAQRP